MELAADLDAPCPPEELFAWVDDLARYPSWLSIVTRAEAYAGDPLAWSVDLRGRVGPFARSKRLRMVRTSFEPPRLAVFERQEDDGRQHAAWVLRAEVSPRPPGRAATSRCASATTARCGGRSSSGSSPTRSSRADCACSSWSARPGAEAAAPLLEPERQVEALAEVGLVQGGRQRSEGQHPALPEEQRVGEAGRDLVDVVGDQHGRRRGRRRRPARPGPPRAPRARRGRARRSARRAGPARVRSSASGPAAPAAARRRTACRTSGRRGRRRPCGRAGRGRGRGRPRRSGATTARGRRAWRSSPRRAAGQRRPQLRAQRRCWRSRRAVRSVRTSVRPRRSPSTSTSPADGWR